MDVCNQKLLKKYRTTHTILEGRTAWQLHVYVINMWTVYIYICIYYISYLPGNMFIYGIPGRFQVTSCDYLRSFDGVYHQQPSHMPDAPGSPQPETSDRSPNDSRIRGNRCPLKESSDCEFEICKIDAKTCSATYPYP